MAPLRAIGPLFGQVYGNRHPGVVALHGWGRRGSDFDRVLAGLDAVSFDLPGFGASAAPETSTGAEGYAEAVIEALQEIAEGPVVVVGHSFGGRVAAVLAARRPEMVSGLVLSGVPLVRTSPPKRPSVGYRLVRAGNKIGLVSDTRMERRRRSAGSADYQAATGVMRDILVSVVNETYEGQLKTIRCPVSLLWGAEDRDVPVAVAEAAHALLAASGTPVSLTVLDGVGHMTPTDAPAALRSEIDRLGL